MRLSPALKAQLDNREALAKALAEQESDLAFKRALFRGIMLAAPLAGGYYLLSHSETPVFDKWSAKKNKNVLNTITEQVRSGEKVVVGEDTDSAVAALEARNAQMKAAVSAVPHTNVSEEELMKMSGRAERAQTGQAETGKTEPTISEGAEQRNGALDAAADGGAPVEKKD